MGSNLSHNKLVTPPEALVGIGTLTKFEHLLKLYVPWKCFTDPFYSSDSEFCRDLSNNSLNTFPSHPYLPALQVLYDSDCLAESIMGTKTYGRDVSHNKLSQSGPFDFTQLSSLQKLYVFHHMYVPCYCRSHLHM